METKASETTTDTVKTVCTVNTLLFDAGIEPVDPKFVPLRKAILDLVHSVTETTAMPTREEIYETLRDYRSDEGGRIPPGICGTLADAILALFSRSAPVLRERRRDESDLTHLIRCYSEYVRRDEGHGPNRCEIANILSCHAPFISEFNDRLTKQAPVRGLRPEMRAKCLRLIEQRIEHAKWGAVPKDIQTAADVAMALIGLAAPQPEEKV